MTPRCSTTPTCHGPAAVEVPAGARKIVLVGNPNVGKSLFFNAFTGLYVDVSNYPGTTVAVSSGKMGADVVLDTPGIYGVSSFNDEETVARDIVIEADVVVNVVDAVHLERDLFLTQQVIDIYDRAIRQEPEQYFWYNKRWVLDPLEEEHLKPET